MQSMEKNPHHAISVVLRLKDGPWPRVDPVCIVSYSTILYRKADLVSQPQGISATDYFRIVFPTSTCSAHMYISGCP